MSDLKVYSPATIEDEPFPGLEQVTTQVQTNKTGDTYHASSTKENKFPHKRPAIEVISSTLNTQARRILGEYQFTKQGAIQIGQYENGASGDVRISPDGISARDNAGTDTFTLDGSTGNATFKGTIQAGALIAGLVTVGNNTWVIDGDPDDPRIVLYNGGVPEIVLGEV